MTGALDHLDPGASSINSRLESGSSLVSRVVEQMGYALVHVKEKVARRRVGPGAGSGMKRSPPACCRAFFHSEL